MPLTRRWFIVGATAATIDRAVGRENDAWETIAPEVRQWYRDAKMPDNPGASCCGEADAYHADSFKVGPGGEYVAIITDDRDVPGRPPVAVGTEILVPNYKIATTQGNPTGHGVIFISVYSDPYTVLCYFPPGGI